jgi:hypothetical protein
MKSLILILFLAPLFLKAQCLTMLGTTEDYIINQVKNNQANYEIQSGESDYRYIMFKTKDAKYNSVVYMFNKSGISSQVTLSFNFDKYDSVIKLYNSTMTKLSDKKWIDTSDKCTTYYRLDDSPGYDFFVVYIQLSPFTN